MMMMLCLHPRRERRDQLLASSEMGAQKNLRARLWCFRPQWRALVVMNWRLSKATGSQRVATVCLRVATACQRVATVCLRVATAC